MEVRVKGKTDEEQVYMGMFVRKELPRGNWKPVIPSYNKPYHPSTFYMTTIVPEHYRYTGTLVAKEAGANETGDVPSKELVEQNRYGLVVGEDVEEGRFYTAKIEREWEEWSMFDRFLYREVFYAFDFDMFWEVVKNELGKLGVSREDICEEVYLAESNLN